MNTSPRPPIEERLRAALAARASTIEPSPDGLDRIEEEIMSDRRLNTTQKWWIGGLSAAAAILLVIVGLVVLGDDDTTSVATDVTTTTSADTTDTTAATTTTEPSTTTTAAPPLVDPYGVAYPSSVDSQRFESPESAAQSYATEVLGFTELVLRDYQAGDSRSGEIPVTDREGGAETVIFVRQMADDTWYVLGSQAPDISVDTPVAGAPVASPFDTTGSALAFEGTVDVVVRTQSDPDPIGTGFVMGSGTPPAGPFDDTIEFTAPAEETPGIVVYRTLSAEDGHVLQATSFPIRLQAV